MSLPVEPTLEQARREVVRLERYLAGVPAWEIDWRRTIGHELDTKRRELQWEERKAEAAEAQRRADLVAGPMADLGLADRVAVLTRPGFAPGYRKVEYVLERAGQVFGCAVIIPPAPARAAWEEEHLRERGKRMVRAAVLDHADT